MGEAISATRWYWAVLTAFVVFLSTTTRSGILTRAYRRLMGTVLGLLAGVVLTYLAHGVDGVLLAICLVSIMGMIYFTPLNYAYAAFFITTTLVALYDVLGVLHGHLLEVRLEETVAGCVCGVLCAYLLLSTTSRPELVATVDAYVDAVDALLRDGADVAASPGESGVLLGRVHAVEASQAEIDQTISAMSTAFLIIGHERVDSARSLMVYRHARRCGSRRSHERGHRPAEAAGWCGIRPSGTRCPAPGRPQLADGRSISDRRRPGSPDNDDNDDNDDGILHPAGGRPPDVGDPTVRAALIALARLTWVMHRPPRSPSLRGPTGRPRPHPRCRRRLRWAVSPTPPGCRHGPVDPLGRLSVYSAIWSTITRMRADRPKLQPQRRSCGSSPARPECARYSATRWMRSRCRSCRTR